jgi:hypothetical protein
MGNIFDFGIGLPYRPASLFSLAGRSDNPIPELTLSPQSGTMNLATVLYEYETVASVGICLKGIIIHAYTVYLTHEIVKQKRSKHEINPSQLIILSQFLFASLSHIILSSRQTGE